MLLNSSEHHVSRIIDLLNAGGVVIFPADTVYGFFAQATSHEAVERVYRIKHREQRKPFVVYTNQHRVQEVVDVTPIGQRLIDAFWPAALALVLPKKPHLKGWLGQGLSNQAVMTAQNHVIRRVISEVREPIIGTTVNLSGEPEMKKGEEVVCFEKEVDALLIDDDLPLYHRPSTMVDCTGPIPYIIRLSAISFEDIASVLPNVEMKPEGRIS